MRVQPLAQRLVATAKEAEAKLRSELDLVLKHQTKVGETIQELEAEQAAVIAEIYPAGIPTPPIPPRPQDSRCR